MSIIPWNKGRVPFNSNIITADHTKADLDEVMAVLAGFDFKVY
jgi:hypothetical protein